MAFQGRRSVPGTSLFRRPWKAIVQLMYKRQGIARGREKNSSHLGRRPSSPAIMQDMKSVVQIYW